MPAAVLPAGANASQGGHLHPCPPYPLAWTEAAPRLRGVGGGIRRVAAWVIKEEDIGGVFVSDVVCSDGAAVHPVGTTLRRKVSGWGFAPGHRKTQG